MTPSTRSGFFLHSTPAATPEVIPCGLIDQRTWARAPAGLGKKGERRLLDTSEEESQRWLDVLEAAPPPPYRQVVTIADSEADVHDLFAKPPRTTSDRVSTPCT